MWGLTVLPGCRGPAQQAPVDFVQLFSETASHCPQMLPELATLLLLPLKRSDSEYAPPYLALF